MDRAKQLLETIDSYGGLKSYSTRRDSRSAWGAVFVFYRRENPRNKMRPGCESCRKVVYDWLRDNAE